MGRMRGRDWREVGMDRWAGMEGFTYTLPICIVFACMPKLHILLVPGVTSRWGMLHEYWVTLYLIGEAKFEEAAAARHASPW